MSKNQDIVVSVIVPCYNQAQYLGEALESVLMQTFLDWECIIVNDGSLDHTMKIAKQWIEKDERFRYLYQTNGGLSSSRNLGIKHSKGKYILPLDADDKISVDYLQLAIKELENNEKLKVVYCRAQKFGINHNLWQLKSFSLVNLAMSNMIFCSAFFRKKDFDLIGGYDTYMEGGLEDWEFWIHLLKTGGEVKQLNKICFYYRIKEQSMIKNLDSNKKATLYRYVSVKHADFFVEQLGSFYSYMHGGIEENKILRAKLKSRKHAFKVLFRPILNLFNKI